MPAGEALAKAVKDAIVSKKRALAAAGLQSVPPVKLPQDLQDNIDNLLREHPDVNVRKSIARIDSLKNFWSDEDLACTRKLRKPYVDNKPPAPPRILATEQGPIRYSIEDSVSYAVEKMSSSYAAHYRVFSEIKRRIPDFRPRQILDFGSGPGTSMWAAREIWPETVQCACLIENSHSMTVVCSRLAEGIVTLPLTNTLPTLPNAVGKGSSKSAASDLVVCAFTMSELPSILHRMAVVKYLWGLTREMLVIIEPATLAGSALVRRLRNKVITTENHAVRSQYRGLYIPVQTGTKDSGVHVVAPCAHDGACPFSKRAEGGICAISQSMQLSSTKKKEGHVKEETFSFVVLRRGFRPNSPWPRQKYQDDVADPGVFEGETTADFSGGWMRIMRTPEKLGNGITIPVCMPIGKNAQDACLEDIKILKTEDQELYNLACQVNWGDLWPR